MTRRLSGSHLTGLRFGASSSNRFLDIQGYTLYRTAPFTARSNHENYGHWIEQ